MKAKSKVETSLEREEGTKCTCDKKQYEKHTCPYKMDVDNECYLPVEKQTLCDCCPYCTEQCAYDI